MSNRLKKKNDAREIWEEDLFESYLTEMDELVNKYPEDPNKASLSEGKLAELIKDLDQNWMEFRKKWQHKIENSKQIFGTAKLKKGKTGMRHLVIKSEFNDNDVLDLIVPDRKKA